MTVIPAIDLRGGKCVQLVGGSFENQPIEIDDVVAVANRWKRAGFTSLHLIDLDAATGRGSNSSLIESLLGDATICTQVGGGVRTTEAVRSWLDMGADRVIVGTRALEDPSWLTSLVTLFPRRIILAMDVRDRTIVARGWTSRIDRGIEAQLAQIASLPLAAVLVTAVHAEGLMSGPDVDLIRSVASQVPFDVQASGGIATIADIVALQDAGADAAIVGMALYTGRLDPNDLPENFKS